MEIKLVFLVFALCACFQQAQSGWWNSFNLSKLFKRQEYDSVASLNGLLEDSVESDDLQANVRGLKGILRVDRGILNDQTVSLAQQFQNLNKINVQNICSDESMNHVESVIKTMKRINPKSFEFPEVKHQLNRIVARAAANQLAQCFDKFAQEWNRSGNVNEIFVNLIDLDYLTSMLSFDYEFGKPEERTMVDVNRWLFNQSETSLDVSEHTIESVRVTLSHILQKQAGSQSTDSKTEIKKYLDDLLISPCKSFTNDSRVASLKKIVSLLVTGNMPVKSVDKFYEQSETMDWAKRFYACQRLLISDENKLVDFMSGSA